LGVPEHSYSITPSGNSGHFQSDHYDDQLELYLNGEYRKLNFTETQVEEQLESHYILTPLSQ